MFPKSSLAQITLPTRVIFPAAVVELPFQEQREILNLFLSVGNPQGGRWLMEGDFPHPLLYGSLNK